MKSINMRRFLNNTKRFFKKIIQPTPKGELTYEKFEELERKKYAKQSNQNHETLITHHPFHCTDDCFRKR